MTSYRPGDTLLVPFPFTDLVTLKKRPALLLAVVVPKHLPPLMLVAMITSQVDAEMIPGDVMLKHWEGAGLIHPSKVRLAKVVTLEEKVVIGKIGRLIRPDWRGVRKEFLKLLSF